jgi:ERCC4-related helicase
MLSIRVIGFCRVGFYNMADAFIKIFDEFQTLFQNLMLNSVEITEQHSGHVSKELAKKWLKDLSVRSEKLVANTKSKLNSILTPTSISTQNIDTRINYIEEEQDLLNSGTSSSQSLPLSHSEDSDNSLNKLNERIGKIEDTVC